MDYGTIKESYKEKVEEAIAFSGLDLNFFTEGKIEYLLDIARNQFSDTSKLKVMDLGCGIGLTDQFLKGKFEELWGLDIAKESIQKAAQTNPWAHYKAYQGGKFPFENNSFDIVFAMCAVQCVPEDQRRALFEEVHRVLKKEGIFTIFEHNGLNPLTRWAAKRFDREFSSLGILQTKKLFRTVGLISKKFSYILLFPSRRKIFRNIEKGIGKIPLGAQYYLVGQKI